MKPRRESVGGRATGGGRRDEAGTRRRAAAVRRRATAYRPPCWPALGLAVLAALLPVVLAPPPAEAAASLPWYQLYERGLERAEAGEWPGALDDFRAAEELEPQARARVRTYGNSFLFAYDPAFQQARALVALERWDAAAAALDRADGAAVVPAAERVELRRRLEAGRTADRQGAPPATGLLRVDSEPAGAEVRVDGEVAGRTPLAPRRLPVGRHRVELRLSGRQPVVQEVRLTPDETTRLQVVLPPARAVPVGEAGEDPAQSAEAGEEGLSVGEGLRGGDGRLASEADADSAAGADGGPEFGAPSLEEGASGGREAAGSGRAGAQLRRDGSPEAPAAILSGQEAAAPDEPSVGSGSARLSGAGETDGAFAAPAGATAPGAAPLRDELATAEAPAGAVPAAVPLEEDGGRLPAGLVASGVLGLLAAALLAAAWVRLRRPAVAHPGQRRASWRLQTGGERRVGDYHVLDELGRGGMAVTYRARRLSDGRTVALKIPHESGDPTYAERFVREGRLGETLHHPGIVRVLEAGEDRGLAFLAMELLPGRTLEEEIRDHPEGLAPRHALEITRAIAEALDYAHGKGIVHRDLKPANVMLLPDGGLKVMDFGVARIEGQPGLTTSRVFFGSPLYAAPELVEPQSIGPPSDLYSLGILLYEMLEGRPPFRHESVFQLLDHHRTVPLPTPARELPPEILDLLRSLCAKNAAARPTPQGLLNRLNHLLHTPTPAVG